MKARLRITIRTALIIVAVVGGLLGFHLWTERRASRFRALADYYSSHHTLILSGKSDLYGDFVGTPEVLDWNNKPVQGLRAERSLYNMSMARKYRQAARNPWLPVAPDLPEPK